MIYRTVLYLIISVFCNMMARKNLIEDVNKYCFTSTDWIYSLRLTVFFPVLTKS